MSERITLDVDGHVFLMGVNRPEKRNAFDLAALEQLAEGYRRLAEDDRLRVGLLYAHGDHFSAGLDWAEVGPAVKDRGPRVLAGGGRYDPFGIWGEPVPKPIVMAVQGIAYTLSIELALASDIARLVAEQAPLAVRATLANARVGRAKGESSAASHMREVLPDILASEDAEEGMRSFIERRKGDFIGR